MVDMCCPPWAEQEMACVQTWDQRCRKSLGQICQSLLAGLGTSWSNTLGHRLRQSAHRILKDSRTTVEGLLQGHVQETAKRSTGLPLVLVAQDTTEFNFTTHPSKKEMGRLRFANTRGILAHGVVALTPAGLSLGVLGVSFFMRERQREEEKLHHNHRTIQNKESQKWLTGLALAEAAFAPEQPLLVIQDREADIFAFLAAPRRLQTALLIRASRSRHVHVADPRDEKEANKRFHPDAAIAAAPVLGRFSVSVPRRPQQEKRVATLELRLRPMIALPPANQLAGEISDPQPIWVIQVTEIQAPAGVQPISWTLISTLPVTTLQEGQQMVEYYTLRWIIERLHYTLKSGCQAEKMQLTDVHNIQNALTLLYIVAWRVLYLTYSSRTHPTQPALGILSSEELIVLGQVSKKEVSTVCQVVIELAKIGGYQVYRNAPPPGVKVVWLGLRSLQDMVEAWKAAIEYMQAKTKDMIQG